MHARIAEISARLLDADGAGPALDRAAAAAFDTVLVSDADRLARPLSAVAADAASRGLALWVVVSPDADGAVRLDAHAAPRLDPWLYDGDAALDPRRPPQSVRAGPVASSDALATAWSARLAAAVGDGVSGFVCRDPDRLSPAFWTRLRAAIAGPSPIRWIAWTAGLAPAAVDALIGAGFDGVVASAAWWDGRGRWLVDELARTAGVDRVAFATDPYAVDEKTHRDAALTIVQRTTVAALVADLLLVAEAEWLDGDVDASTAVNRWFAARGARREHLRFATGPDARITALVATPHPDLRASDRAVVALVNPDRQRRASIDASIVTTLLSGFGDYREIGAASEPATFDATMPLVVDGGAARLFEAQRLPAIRIAIPSPRRSADAGLEKPRLSIEAITPTVDGGRFPAKRTAGDSVRVEADLLIDGHEKLAGALLHRAVGDRDWRETRMEPIGNDRYAARFPLARVGRHEFTIEAWSDVFANYRYELEKKSQAGLDVSLELIEGRRLIESAVAFARTQRRPDVTRRLSALAASLASNPAAAEKTGEKRDVDRAAMAAATAELLSSQTLADMQRADRREFATRPDVTFPIDAERSGASFAAWYELFPRSLGNPPGAPATHHGTFDDVIERLPAVKAMGFDVLYFPPINPIGKRNRKGKNNSLTAHEGEPGSPYAIGSADGGHDAIHPELGTFDDFRRLRDAAIEHGLELALDFAIQCSPDHPWLKDHPGWFAWRPDGSLRYAENPPKKYEDIVNVDFYGHADKAAGRDDSPQALWSALRDVVLLWCSEGVRLFRVDNPHTKPLPFWEWMIGEVRAKYPDAVFLAEAFTRPKLMYRLAKLGYSQSYTYFTWRHTKDEFIEYLTELTSPKPSLPGATASPRDFFRPHFFVNTPDINPVFLQRSGRPGFLIRAALAATLSGLWGVYSGFELCEASPMPGKEEYLDSEKYEIRAWDWQRPGNIVAEITQLNRIRNENPALRTHLNVRFENVFDPNILYFQKATQDRSNVLLIAINLDPYGVHEADFELPLWQWDLPDDAGVDVTDLVDGHRFRWQGKRQRMRLDPNVNPYAIWRVAS